MLLYVDVETISLHQKKSEILLKVRWSIPVTPVAIEHWIQITLPFMMIAPSNAYINY